MNTLHVDNLVMKFDNKNGLQFFTIVYAVRLTRLYMQKHKHIYRAFILLREIKREHQ